MITHRKTILKEGKTLDLVKYPKEVGGTRRGRVTGERKRVRKGKSEAKGERALWYK